MSISVRSRSGSLSQPPTPLNTAADFHTQQQGAAARSSSIGSSPLRHSFSNPGTAGRSRGGGGSGGLFGAATSGGGGTPGGSGSARTVREYDESMRELRKENFNLKLRIYFLEERLGSTSSSRAAAMAGTDKEEMAKANTNLKVCIYIGKHFTLYHVITKLTFSSFW